MYKLKNSKTALKRIKKITRNGKILRRNMSAQHRMHGKNKKIKARSSETPTVSSANYKNIKKLIPLKGV